MTFTECSKAPDTKAPDAEEIQALAENFYIYAFPMLMKDSTNC